MSGQYGRYIVFCPDSQPDELLHRHHTGQHQGDNKFVSLMLACARHMAKAGTQWGCKRYMNMKHLEAALDDVSIAG